MSVGEGCNGVCSLCRRVGYHHHNCVHAPQPTDEEVSRYRAKVAEMQREVEQEQLVWKEKCRQRALERQILAQKEDDQERGYSLCRERSCMRLVARPPRVFEVNGPMVVAAIDACDFQVVSRQKVDCFGTTVCGLSRSDAAQFIVERMERLIYGSSQMNMKILEDRVDMSVSDQVKVMKECGMQASAGKVKCGTCQKIVEDFLSDPANPIGAYVCLECMSKKTPNCPRFVRTLKGSFIAQYGVMSDVCVGCKAQLSRAMIRRGNVKCVDCRMKEKYNCPLYCLFCSKKLSSSSEKCCAKYKSMEIYDQTKSLELPCPRTYSVGAPGSNVCVDTSFTGFLPAVGIDPGFMFIKSLQVASFCAMLGCTLTPEESLQVWHLSIRDQYQFIEKRIKDPGRCTNLARVLPTLSVNTVEAFDALMRQEMVKDRRGRTLVIGEFDRNFVPDCEQLMELSGASKSRMQHRPEYESIYVFDQTYLIDLSRLRQTLRKVMMKDGVCKIRVVNSSDITILFQYARECVVSKKYLERLIFRDMCSYNAHFSKHFGTSFQFMSYSNGAIVVDYNTDIKDVGSCIMTVVWSDNVV